MSDYKYNLDADKDNDVHGDTPVDYRFNALKKVIERNTKLVQEGFVVLTDSNNRIKQYEKAVNLINGHMDKHGCDLSQAAFYLFEGVRTQNLRHKAAAAHIEDLKADIDDCNSDLKTIIAEGFHTAEDKAALDREFNVAKTVDG